MNKLTGTPASRHALGKTDTPQDQFKGVSSEREGGGKAMLLHFFPVFMFSTSVQAPFGICRGPKQDGTTGRAMEVDLVKSARSPSDRGGGDGGSVQDSSLSLPHRSHIKTQRV